MLYNNGVCRFRFRAATLSANAQLAGLCILDVCRRGFTVKPNAVQTSLGAVLARPVELQK